MWISIVLSTLENDLIVYTLIHRSYTQRLRACDKVYPQAKLSTLLCLSEYLFCG